MEKLVSIVIPVYNMADSIETCLDSIRKQTYREIEIILVDDGSTDDSYQKCCELAAKDSRIVVYHTENQGAGPARNYGIDHAKGNYIYFPDADDYLDPETIAVCVAAMENGKHDLVVFGFQTLMRDGKFLSEQKYRDCIKTGEALRGDYSASFGYNAEFAIQGAPWNKFFSLEVIRKNGVEFPPLRRHQDEGFISRYMCFAKSVHFIDRVFYYYYENDLNNQWKKFPNNYIDIVIGLFAIRKETILTWNPQDYATHEMVENEYLSKVVKALELSYSPKMKLTRQERFSYFQEVCEKANIQEHKVTDSLGYYQKAVCQNLQSKRYSAAMNWVCLKLWTEETGIIRVLRRVLHK